MLRNETSVWGARFRLCLPGERSHEHHKHHNGKHCQGLGLLYDPRHSISLRIELPPFHPKLLIPYCSHPSSSPIPSTTVHPPTLQKQPGRCHNLSLTTQLQPHTSNTEQHDRTSSEPTPLYLRRSPSVPRIITSAPLFRGFFLCCSVT